MNSDNPHTCFRELIFRSELPVVFYGSINWDILKWSIDDWLKAFENRTLNFRSGRKICQNRPIWESECETECLTFKEFIALSNEKSLKKDKWWYFDYKHIPEHFADEKDFFLNLSWTGLGFPEKGPNDSTIWIGSAGAHTACHFDSYGCNIVAQVLGKKRWLLFPPSETDGLKPTRVPYEESSIYSSINFSCSQEVEKHLKSGNCFFVDLNPGDVLLVPPKWWHYVENLTLAISVNMWIPVENDDISRLDEALVRYFISCLSKNVTNDMKKILLNPNELDLEFENISLDIIKFCKEKIVEKSASINLESKAPNCAVTCHKHQYRIIREISAVQLQNILPKCENSHEIDHSEEFSSDISTLSSIINTFCHPDIICQVRNKILFP